MVVFWTLVYKYFSISIIHTMYIRLTFRWLWTNCPCYDRNARLNYVMTWPHGTYIIYGNPEIGAHVRRNLSYLICLRHLIGSRAVTYRIFFLWKYLVSSIRSQHVLSYYLIMVPCMHLIHAKNICWAILRRGLKINLYKTSWSKNKLITGEVNYLDCSAVLQNKSESCS